MGVEVLFHVVDAGELIGALRVDLGDDTIATDNFDLACLSLTRASLPCAGSKPSGTIVSDTIEATLTEDGVETGGGNTVQNSLLECALDVIDLFDGASLVSSISSLVGRVIIAEAEIAESTIVSTEGLVAPGIETGA